MKKILLLISIFALLFTMSCVSEDDEKGSVAAYSGYEGLSKLVDEQSEEYYLIDVRTDAEFKAGNIPTAVNIPYDVIGSNMPTDDKDALIIVYCRSGNRSGQAFRTLKALGYTNLHDFGAFSKWKG